MDLTFKDFSWKYFGFENYALLSFMLLAILFLLFEYFPGRNYFYSLNALKKFIDKHLISHLIQGSESKKKAWLRMMIVSLIWVLLVAALANPRWDFEEVESAKPNVNLVILLDISKSMDSKDERPSRLERAKQEIIDIVKKADMANIGILAFANQAHIVSPVTDDKNAILYLLPSVTTNLVGVQGSNIEAGLKAADLLLKSLNGGINYVLIMSDGGFENPSELKSMSNLVKNGKIISFGIGGSEGAPIPDVQGKFIKEGDKIVLTKLEKENLINLSGLDNYIQSSYLDDDTEKVVKIVSKQITTAKQKSKLFKIWHDRFYIPLLLAMLLILPFFRRGAMFPVVLIMLFATQTYAQDEDDTEAAPTEEVAPIKKSTWEKVKSTMFKNSDQQAYDLYDEKQYKAAEEKFFSSYNKGVSLYRKGDLAGAESYFSKDAATNIESEYNLGNAQLLQKKIKEAIASYEDVLKKDPQHKDAKTNLEIAKKLLKQEQKNQNNSQNNKKNNEQQNQDDKNNQGQDKQSQQGDQQDKNQQGKGQDGDKDNDKQNGDKNGQNKNDKNDSGKGDQNKDKQGQNKNDQKNNGLNDSDQKEGESGENAEESDGNSDKKELDIQAKSILSKISSDPAKLMNSRFKYEEQKNGAGAYNSKNPKPW